VVNRHASEVPLGTITHTQHTLGHLNCPACLEVRASLLSSISADLLFSEAAQRWLESRKVNAAPGAISARYIRKTTEESYEAYARTLDLFFSGMKLGSIRIEHLLAYQKARVCGDAPFVRYRRPQDAKPKIDKNGAIIAPPKGKTPCPAKPKKIRQELNLLIHLLKRANCWTDEMQKLYQMHSLPPDEDDEIPRALEPQEQRHWLDVARMKTRWNVVYWYSILAFHTCMSTDEIRGIRLGDINLFQRIITVPRKSAKNRYRMRTIELVGADVLWALERLIERAAELGSTEPHHYLLPMRISAGKWDAQRKSRLGVYDPTRPMTESGIKKAWEEVREASGLKWFRQYDCRHTAITRLAESGVPIDVIMARAGHVSERMRRHYTHISQAAQRKWLEHSYRFSAESVMYSHHHGQFAALRR
jgi:integrase